MNTYGKNIRISIFGESHGPAIGLTIDGLPSNLTIDFALIEKNLARRRGQDDISTPRREPDSLEILSGYFNNQTTGSPLTIIIKNQQFQSSNYQPGIIRPSHSDLSQYLKYHGANDYRGGGHSSGRLTSCLVIVGSICQQILATQNIACYSYVSSLYNITTPNYSIEHIISTIKNFTNNDFTIEKHIQDQMISLIKTSHNDTLGGTVRTIVSPCPSSLGEPFFGSFESSLSHLVFSIPGIKGLLFGDGLKLTSLKGSEQIDEIEYDENKHLKFKSNHQGGINGGISNGNYLDFSVVVRAPSSSSLKKQTINVLTQENITLSTSGQHDTTFVHRILPVIEAITYWTILDLSMENNKYGKN